jgi:hypothetical protein
LKQKRVGPRSVIGTPERRKNSVSGKRFAAQVKLSGDRWLTRRTGSGGRPMAAGMLRKWVCKIRWKSYHVARAQENLR